MDQTAISPSAPVATGRSRLAGLVDRFAWPLQASSYLALVNPRFAGDARHGRLEDAWDEGRDVRTLLIRPGRDWPRHLAGQHVRLGVPIGGVYHTRTYSISSAPGTLDGCFTITVKAVPDGRVSQHLVREIRTGTQLQLGPPEGDFVLPEVPRTSALFVTGGSGITPIMSMLRDRAARGGIEDVVHLHHSRSAFEMIFRDELDALSKTWPGYRLHALFTRTPENGRSRPTRFSHGVLQELCPDWEQRNVHACGPQGLLAAVEAHWGQAGLEGRLRVERFRAPLAEVPMGAAGGRVHFTRSKLEIAADGSTSLLRVAESAGLAPPHGCRMGICHSCTATLCRGRVRDLRNNTVIDEPGARVQICVCAAAGDVELEA